VEKKADQPLDKTGQLAIIFTKFLIKINFGVFTDDDLHVYGAGLVATASSRQNG
jgi:hypothetical protein